MSDDTVQDETQEVQEETLEKPKGHDSGKNDLEKVTDFAEEKEIDTADMNQAMSFIEQKQKKATEERAQRAAELAKVVVKDEDVNVIVEEFELSKDKATTVLREHKGDLEAALRHLSQ
eukprot:Colp12_sorted_trinity150504_noHs@12748